MITTKFENTYSSVYNAKKAIADLDTVVEFLRAQSEPLTCKQIGLAVFGDKYVEMNRHFSTHLGQILKHLRQGGFIKVTTMKGAPIEVDDEILVYDNDKNGEPSKIIVHDEAGNKYCIDNPRYQYSSRGASHWEKVKKTIIPTIKFYAWVEK